MENIAIDTRVPTEKHAYLFLFAAILFMRLPFFFRDYSDWDESTFILVGESVAQGNLPYTELWDLKPPLVFYFFGLVQKIFPDSLVAIRLMGVFVIFFSSVLVMKIAGRCGFRNGFLAAILYALLSTQYEYLQGVMSEHLAVFFSLSGMYFFVHDGSRPKLNFILSGTAFGLALMCKLNYAYPLFFLFLFLSIIAMTSKSSRYWLNKILYTGAGVVLAMVVVATPYIFQNNFTLFFDSVFLASFEYGHQENLSLSDMIRKTWVVLLVAVLVSVAAVMRAEKRQKILTIAMVVFLLGTAYTFMIKGIANGHYRVLALPFFLILLLGVVAKREFSFRPLYLALIVFALSFQSVYEYYKVLNSYVKNGSPYNGKAYDVLAELKNRKLDKKKILFARYHICYWLLDQKPFAKSMTHPSNLNRPFLFKYFDNPEQTSLGEFKRIMNGIRPEVVVSGEDELIFEDQSYEGKEVSKYMYQHFDLMYNNEEDDTQIWVRKNQ